MKVIDVCCCFCFIFTFSLYKAINNNKMPRKKKQTLYTSLSEQQQFLENFYNDLNHGAFIGHKSGGEGKHESKTSCSSSDNDVDVSGKDTDCTSQPVDDKDFVPRNKMT